MLKYRFRRKIVLASVAAVIVLVMVLTAAIGTYYIRITLRNQEQQMDFLSQNVASQISMAVEMLDEISLQLSANVYAVDVFSALHGSHDTENYFTQMLSQDAEMKRFMWSYILKRNSVYRICLLNDANDFTYVGTAVDYRFLQAGSTIPFAQTLKKSFEEDGGESVYHIYSADPFLSQDGEPIFAVRREIHDTSIVPARTVGYVEVQYQVKNFVQYYDFESTDLQGFLLDDKDRILLQYNATEDALKMVRQMDLAQSGESSFWSTSNDYSVRVEELEKYGLRLVLVQDTGSYRQFLWTTLGGMIVAAALIIAVMLTGQYLLVRRVTQPIADLCGVLENLDPNQSFGEEPLRMPGEMDELIQLNYAFGNMMKNLRSSMEKTMAAQVGEIQSHMLALQAQMNPHFIHNIISVISAMADEENYSRIPGVCQLLSEMIRYSSDYDDSLVSVQDELRNTINYLELMKQRYEDHLIYSVNFVGDAYDHYIPKFIFQPLVENFFKNGTKNREFPWRVDITLRTDQTRWSFEVQDNGAGAGKEKVEQLYQKFAQAQTKTAQELMGELRIGGLSIYNILIRLSILYGANVLFEVQSPPDGGFRIKIGGVLYQDSSNGGGGRATDPSQHLPENSAGGTEL